MEAEGTVNIFKGVDWCHFNFFKFYLQIIPRLNFEKRSKKAPNPALGSMDPTNFLRRIPGKVLVLVFETFTAVSKH